MLFKGEDCSKERWTRDLDLARLMGTFRVRAWKVTQAGEVREKPRPRPSRASDLEFNMPLSEKALTKLREDEGKMISHAVK